jgi:hypothetical protein
MLKVAYQIGVKLAEQQQKEAGIRDFLKFLTTGRSTAYHGTSVPIAKAIREGGGIIPRKSRGVSDVLKEVSHDPTMGKQLAFFTRSPGSAKSYASQQGFIEGAGTTPQQLFLKTTGNEIDLLPALQKAWSGIRGGIRSRGEGVIKAQYPFRKFSPIKNPEGRALAEEVGGKSPPKALERLYGLLFRKTYGLKAPTPGAPAMPTKFIRGTKDYQRVTLPEIKEHLSWAQKNPLSAAGEALRSLTEVQAL